MIFRILDWRARIFSSFRFAGGLVFMLMSLRAGEISWAQSPAEEFQQLHKTWIQRFQPAAITDLHRATSAGILVPTVALAANSELRSRARSIGRLDVLYRDGDGPEQSSNTCTAAIVDSGVLLTASHCVPGSEGLTAVKAKIVMAYYAYGQNEDRRFETSVVPVEARGAGLDFALLRTAEQVGTTYGVIPLKARPVLPGETLYIIHHPLGQGQRLSTRRCVASTEGDPQDVVFFHGCATMGGSSGAPVFAFTDGALVGLHTRGDGEIGGRALRIEAILRASPWLTRRVVLVSAPASASVHRTGYIFATKQFRKIIVDSLRDDARPDAVESLIKETGGPNAEIDGERLVELAVAAASAPAVTVLIAKGAMVRDDRGGRLVHRVIESFDNFQTQDLGVLEALLQGGAPVTVTENGLWPFCKSRQAVRTLFATRRPELKC